jgi:hypothetical protein
MSEEKHSAMHAMSETPETDAAVNASGGDWSPVLRAVAQRLERQRDEAREALMKIEDLFIDGTDIYADREKMGTISRAALEGAK